MPKRLRYLPTADFEQPARRATAESARTPSSASKATKG